SSQEETEDEPADARIQRPEPALGRAADVAEPEIGAEEDRRRPESDSRRGRVLHVAAVEELLRETDDETDHRVAGAIRPDVGARDRDRTEVEHAGDPHRREKRAQGDEADEESLPEAPAKRLAPRQAVFGDRSSLDPRHHEAGEEAEEEPRGLVEDVESGAVESANAANGRVPDRHQKGEDPEEDEQAPTRAQPGWAEENAAPPRARRCGWQGLAHLASRVARK